MTQDEYLAMLPVVYTSLPYCTYREEAFQYVDEWNNSNGDRTAYSYTRAAGHRKYELSNHLGNVLATITDRKIFTHIKGDCKAGKCPIFEPDIASGTDYTPFGMAMSGRTFKSKGYRYGFNTQESSPEIADNHTTAFFGEYDARIGRRWNPDPKPNASTSIYSCFGNSPIWISDVMLDTPTVREAALMSEHVYGGGNVHLEGGWKVSSRVSVQYQHPSGLKSGLYERTLNGITECTYAFAGTEDIWKDGIQDVKQLAGFSEQYDLAIYNAGEINKNLGGQELSFTGHSLGGGLANAAALSLDKASLTFNPAWVSRATAHKHGLLGKSGKGIHNYIVFGELLDDLQKASKLNLLTTPVLIHVGNDHYLRNWEWMVPPILGSFILGTGDAIENHMMKSVFEELNDVDEYKKVKNGY